MRSRKIVFALILFTLGLWAPEVQGSLAPYYEVQTAWFGDPPTSEFVFIQNTDGANSWAGDSPSAVEMVAINDNLNSAGVGTPPGGFYGSQGAVVAYHVPGVAGNGGFDALSSAFPSDMGGPGGSGLPTDLGEAILYVDVAFEVPGHPEITSLSNVLNFWVQETDGDNFELQSDFLDLTTNDWQTYMYTLSTLPWYTLPTLPLEDNPSGVFGDSDVTLVSVEFEDPASPDGLEYIIYFVDNFRIESYGETLFFEDFEPQTVTITVDIDIKPGSFPNAINKNGKGVIPVAILGSANFDVTQIDVSTLSFAGMTVRIKGNDQPQCSIDDVSGDLSTPEGAPDGYDDLVCQFVDDTSSWTVGEGEAMLTGELLDGTPFEGTDSIKVVK